MTVGRGPAGLQKTVGGLLSVIPITPPLWRSGIWAASGWVYRTFVDAHAIGFASIGAATRRTGEICRPAKPARDWIGTWAKAKISSLRVNAVHLLAGAIGKPGPGPILMAGLALGHVEREAGAPFALA